MSRPARRGASRSNEVECSTGCYGSAFTMPTPVCGRLAVTFPRRALAPLLLGLTAACGGAQGRGPEVAARPFLEEHEAMFENGIDMVRDPEALDGGWLGTWQSELDDRVTHADAVALVTVRTLRTDVDLDRNETYRLIVSVDREYLGELPDEVALTVDQTQRGYGTVRNNERRLLDQRFLAFIKWQDTERGPRPRWHLSPATEPVAAQTFRLLASRRNVQMRSSRRVVTVHRDGS